MPDFFVVHADGTIEFVEVKRHLRDDAFVKFRWAVDKFPWFKWTMVTRKGGQFVVMYEF